MRRKYEGEILGLGRISMVEPSVRAMRDARRVLGEAEPETALSQFTEAVLAGMIVDPPMTADQVAGLPDDVKSDLIDLAATDVLNLRQELSELPDGLSPPEMFAVAYRKHVEEFMQNIGRMVAGSANQTLQWAGDTLAKSVNDHLVDATSLRVGLDFSDILDGLASQVSPTADLSEVIKALREPSPEFKEAMKRLTGPSTAFGEALRALAEQSTMSLQARVRELNSHDLVEPFLSDNLIKSGLNSSYVHSPTYEAPDLQLPPSLQEIPEYADAAERERLRDAYDVLMNLELGLRGFIEQKLVNLNGPKWWRQRVPGTVCDECEGRKRDKEKPHGPSHDPISYAHVHDLKVMIVRKDNWREVFQAYFIDKKQIELMFDWVSAVRDSVAHYRPIDDMEYQQFLVAANVIRRGIDRAI